MNQIIKYWDNNIVERHIGNEINWLYSYLDDRNIKKISYIDIGANVGKFYDILSKKYEIDRCIMVEPSETLSNYMKEKYQNDETVDIFNFGISDENGSFYFKDSVEISIKYFTEVGINESVNLGLSKIYKNIDGDTQCYSMEYFLENFNTIPFENITFIKIDTENMDLNIIKSMTKLFSEKNINPFILFENNFQNTMSIIEATQIISDFCDLCGYETTDLLSAGDKFLNPIDKNKIIDSMNELLENEIKNTQPKVILTLTTVPRRLHNPNESAGVKPGLEILLNLSYSNYEVHFNIPLYNKKTEEEYIIPNWLKDLELKYEKLKVFRTDDYGPVTKLVPTLFRFDKDDDITIISVEDDLYYMDGFIEYHLKMREKYPESILGFAGISSLNSTCHFCTTCKEDVKVRILESYKTISYKRNFFKTDFFSEFVGQSWNDDILISAYFGKHGRDKIVLSFDGDTDFNARVESFPCIGHVPNEQSGCFLYRNERVSDNSDLYYRLGYL